MRNEVFFGVMSVALGLAACDGRTDSALEGMPPDYPPALLTMDPTDVTSAVGDGPLTIAIDDSGREVPQAVLLEVAANLELSTFPELEEVPFELVVTPSTPVDPTVPSVENPARATVELVPSMPLEDRWYMISLAALPAGTRVYPVEAHAAAEYGKGLVARFNPVASPVLRGITLCGADYATTVRVAVDFSEDVMADAALPAHLAVAEQDGTPCSWLEDTGGGPLQSRLHFDCSAAAWTHKVVEFSMLPGLATPNGEVVGVFDSDAATASTLVSTNAMVEEIAFGAQPAAGLSCNIFRVR